MIIPIPVLFGLVIAAGILACLTSGPGRKETGNRWGHPQQMSQMAGMPSGPYPIRRSSSFLTTIVWLILIAGGIGAALEIWAPSVLHSLLRLWGLS